MKKILIAILFLIFSLNIFSSEPILKFDSANKAYFTYSGKVKHAYVDESNLILVYFDTVMSSKTLNDGQKVYSDLNSYKANKAASYSINHNKDFANYLYATVLAAKVSGQTIGLEMRSTVAGYLKIDRIWLFDE